MEKSGGFDMAKITTASKIVMVAGILLLVDSFLSWQKVCFDTGVLGDICAKANAWGGSGGWAGVIMGILLIILLIWEGTQLAEMPMNLSIGVTPTKGTAYLGFAVVIFGLLKFIFAITNEGSLGAWIGLVLLIAIGYGSWMKFQEPETVAAPPASGGSDGGFTALILRISSWARSPKATGPRSFPHPAWGSLMAT